MRSNRELSGNAGSSRTSEIRIVTLFVPLLLLSALLLSASSCRPLLREVFTKPKVQLVSVGFAGNPFVAKEPLEAIINLSVTNPNSYALTVSRAAYAVNVGKHRLATGEKAEQVRIEPSGETIVKIPVSIDPDAFHLAMREVVDTLALPYDFSGSLSVEAPLIGAVRVPFSKQGTIDPLDFLRKKRIEFN